MNKFIGILFCAMPDRGQQNEHQPPQAAVDACANLTENSSCSFIGRNQNTVSGTCDSPPNSSQLACKPAGGRPPKQ